MVHYAELLALGPIDGKPEKPEFKYALFDFNERLYSIIKDKKPKHIADISFGGSYTVDMRPVDLAGFIEHEPNFKLKHAKEMGNLRRKGEFIWQRFYELEEGAYFHPLMDKTGEVILRKVDSKKAFVFRTCERYERKFPAGQEVRILPLKAFKRRRI